MISGIITMALMMLLLVVIIIGLIAFIISNINDGIDQEERRLPKKTVGFVSYQSVQVIK